MRVKIATMLVLILTGLAAAQSALQHVERDEQRRWLSEDLYMRQQYELRRGTPPRDISQRTPEQKRLVEEMTQFRKRRISEVLDALRRYCPSGEPPCSPDPPQYLLEQAISLGLIERRPRSAPVPPQAGCYGMIDPEGPITFECYGTGPR